MLPIVEPPILPRQCPACMENTSSAATERSRIAEGRCAPLKTAASQGKGEGVIRAEKECKGNVVTPMNLDDFRRPASVIADDPIQIAAKQFKVPRGASQPVRTFSVKAAQIADHSGGLSPANSICPRRIRPQPKMRLRRPFSGLRLPTPTFNPPCGKDCASSAKTRLRSGGQNPLRSPRAFSCGRTPGLAIPWACRRVGYACRAFKVVSGKIQESSDQVTDKLGSGFEVGLHRRLPLFSGSNANHRDVKCLPWDVRLFFGLRKQNSGPLPRRGTQCCLLGTFDGSFGDHRDSAAEEFPDGQCPQVKPRGRFFDGKPSGPRSCRPQGPHSRPGVIGMH